MIDMSPELVTILMFLGILTGLALGHPVAFVLGGLATIFALLGWGPQGWYMFLGRTFDSTTNNILIAIPNFVLMATLLGKSGIANRLFRSIMYLLGPLNGAIALAVIVWCAIEAACTGVIGASVVSMSILAMPVLLGHGYDKRISCGSIMAGGTLSILIPPSIMLVMMADLGGISVGRLFAGAFGPGILLTILFFIYILVLTNLHPEKGPALPLEERQALSIGQKAKYIAVNLIPPAILIIGVLGSIWMGVATATEASGMGAFLAFVLMVVYREFSWKALADCVWSAAKTNCMVMTIIVGATVFTGVFLGLGCGQVVTDIIRAFDFLGKWGMFGIMMFIVFLLGFMIDWIAIIYITFPIFLPIAKELGFDLTWFIILLAVNLQTSFLSPPFGYALFYMQATAPPGIVLKDIYRSILPFIIFQLISLSICILFPIIVTYLPSVLIR
jgi:tripartite ATP-independent transporter DctM subunit